MSDRERLAKLMGYEDSAWDLALRAADALLAAGVTLPPAPERLVTEEMLDEASKVRGGSQKYWTIEPAGANALVEAAIRRAVERKTERDGFVEVATRGGIRHWVDRNALLALFDLEAS